MSQGEERGGDEKGKDDDEQRLKIDAVWKVLFQVWNVICN